MSDGCAPSAGEPAASGALAAPAAPPLRAWPPTVAQVAMLDIRPPHHVHQVLHLEKAPDAALLQAALDGVVVRHSMLRTTFIPDRELGWQATTHSKLPTMLEVIELGSMTPAASLERIRELAQERTDEAFNLATGPLMRLTLLMLSDGTALLIFVAHHAVCDAWSTAIVLAEMLRLYAGLEQGQPSRLPPVTFEFPDYAGQLKEWLQSPAAQPHIRYWESMVGRGEPFDVPHDRTSPPGASLDLPPVQGVVPAEIAGRLRQLSREEQVTVFACVATAVAVSLAEWSGRSDAVFWILHLGRPRVELAAAVGTFASSWVLRIDLARSSTLRKAIRNTHALQVSAAPHTGVTPDVTIGHLTSCGIPLASPIILNFLPYRASRANGPSLPVRRIDLIPGRGRFDPSSGIAMVINAVETQDSIHWSIQHNCGMFEDSTIVKLSGQLAQALRTLAFEADRASAWCGVVVAEPAPP